MELARSGHTGRGWVSLTVQKFRRHLRKCTGVFGFPIPSFLLLFHLHNRLNRISYCFGSSSENEKQPSQNTSSNLKIYKEYNLYYLLSILYGARKQIFLTFAPWVLVTIFKKPTTTVATLMTIGGAVGIFFQPFIGWCIDRFGEKLVLASEAVVLIVICIGYGTAKDLFSSDIAFFITAVCFIVDGLLMSVGMARATWLKKIALHPSHVTPTLQMAAVGHVFSISGAVFCGMIWKIWGYQYVFLCCPYCSNHFFSALN